ncbi:MAG TPA: hypothetical protein VF505_13610 [Thermoanaerobaculia bacterium]
MNHYQRAIQDNPGETIFSQEYNSILSSRIGAPLNRAQASLTGYEAWTAGKHTGSSRSETAHRKSSGPMNNQTLLSMAQAGLTDENLILARRRRGRSRIRHNAERTDLARERRREQERDRAHAAPREKMTTGN